MASIRTKKYREKLAKASAGLATIPKVVSIVFGTGGTIADGTPKGLTGDENSLFAPVLEKSVVATFPTASTARYSYKVVADVDGLIDQSINELGLMDAEGDLIAIKTFTNKTLDAGNEIEFDYDMAF